MAQDAVDYILGVLARKSPLIDTYKKAKTIFSAIKLILENKQPLKVTKDDAKVAIDVLEEIQNLSAKSEAEKEHNARYALLCKLLVDGLSGVMVWANGKLLLERFLQGSLQDLSAAPYLLAFW